MSRPGTAGFGPPARSSFPLWKTLVVIALVLELVVILFLIANRSDVEVSAQSERPSESPSIAQGGRFEELGSPYRFSYPKSWNLETEGSVTKLLSPGNEIAIAVGPAPPGDVLLASDRLIAGLTNRYDNARTKDRELTSVGGNLGLTVTGSAVNEFGVKVRFAVITFEGDGGGNFAITSFAAGADRDEADRALQEVIGDFEVLN
jgi:hypothetical protein